MWQKVSDGGKKERERLGYSGPSSSDALSSMAAGILHQMERCERGPEEWEQGDEEDAEEKGLISNYLVSPRLG